MKKLPIDISVFKDMIEGDYLYIDKTEQIYKLIQGNKFYFLSRPRRFGKSLLISTLYELFSGNKNLFKKLWISNSTYDWQKYPTIYLNFSMLDISNSQELTLSLIWKLETIASSYNIDITSAPTIGSKLQSLVNELSKINKVVILIDEYDYPLINKLHTLEIAKENRDVLKNFFSIVKALESNLRFIFITGVTKFSKTSLFSGLNNLNDITTDPIAAELLGYTEREIITNLDQEIKLIAKSNTLKGSITEELKLWYNGYRFSREDIKVYNPFSILYCFNKKRFDNYWFQSGTPSFLVELLKSRFYILDNLEDSKFSDLSLGTFDFDNIPLITVLFQTGYLTIKNYDKKSEKYILGYPNIEVQESFDKYLLAILSKADIPVVEDTLSQIKQALNQNNIDLFCLALQSLFANIPYQLHIPQEKYYHSLLQLLMNLLSIDGQSEISTDKGRIDLVIKKNKYIYIFEFKFESSPKKALDQIDRKKYYEKYLLDKKEIILVGISFKKLQDNVILECSTKSIN